MKKILLVLALAVITLAGCKSGGTGTPDFQLKDIVAGDDVSLSAFKGKVVLIDFWATWCPPCRMEIPHLIALNDQYHAKGLEVIGISIDQGDEAVVSNFAREWKMTYHVVHDIGGVVAGKFGGVQAIPTAFLIGKDGSIISRSVGYKAKEELEAEITKALESGK